MKRMLIVSVFLGILFQTVAQEKLTLTLLIKNDKGAYIRKSSGHILNQNIEARETSDGTLSFSGLAKGNHDVYVTADGYASKIINISLESNMSIPVTLIQDYKNLDDIVISSDKKESSLIKAPSSSTVITAKQARDLRLWEIGDLSGISPNLYIAHSGDNRNVTGIRGVVTTSYEQAVATYIDGVAQFGLDTYIPQLNDIESIEIIRGVQSTYYGRNALGGIINISTKQPENRVSANADVQFGSYGQKRVNASVKTPIIKNKLFAGLSYLHDGKNGFYTNDYNNSHYDKQRQNLLNFQLKYYIKDGWTVQADVKRYMGSNNGAFPLVADLDELFKNPYRLSQNQTASMRDRTGNASLVVKRRGTKTDITFQTALQNNYRYYTKTLDADFSPFDIVGIFNDYGKTYNTVDVFTNEFRIGSKNGGNTKIEWNAGAFHYRQKSPTRQATVFGEDAGFMGIPDKNFSLISTNIAKNDGLAAYGDLKIALTKKIVLSGGIRADNEWRKLTVRGEYEKLGQSFVTRADTSASSHYSAVSPRIGLQFLGSQSQTVYINFSRGFRAGGLSAITSDPSQIPLWAYKPEYSNMAEIGLKGQNEAKTLRYNFALFYNHINNIQSPRLILPDAVTVTQNAGKLNTSGIEAEIVANPLKGLTFQYAGGLTHAKYSSLKGVSNGAEIDLSGNRQIFTPKSTHFTSLQYQFSIGKSMLSLRAEYNRTGEQFFDLANQINQKAYGLLNFRCGIRTSQLELFVWGRNMGGVRYIDYAYDFGAAHLGEPRMIGAGISWRY